MSGVARRVSNTKIMIPYFSLLFLFSIVIGETKFFYATTILTFDNTYGSTSRGIAVNPNQKELYYSSTSYNQILKVNYTGVYVVASASSLPVIVMTNTSVTADNSENVFVQLNYPSGLVISGLGDKLFVADGQNHVIRRIDPNGNTAVVAGLIGDPNYAEGNSSTARFNNPSGVALNMSDVFVADTGNHRIRKITLSGFVTTFAGGPQGSADGLNATFNSPQGLAFDNNGNIIVADTGNHKIRKINRNGEVVTIAGSGLADFADGHALLAHFNAPTDVAVDNAGNIYVADSLNNRIRMINTTGYVSTVIGDGTSIVPMDGIHSSFAMPVGIDLDLNGNAYVSQNGAIRKVSQVKITAIDSTLDATSTLKLFVRGTNLDQFIVAVMSLRIDPAFPPCTNVAFNVTSSTVQYDCGMTTIAAGSFYPSITINSTDIANDVLCSFPPIVSSIYPTDTFENVVISIKGNNFGDSNSTISVDLSSNSSIFSCDSPTWINSGQISCAIPTNLPLGPFGISVSVSNRISAPSAVTGNNAELPIINSVSLIAPTDSSTIAAYLLNISFSVPVPSSSTIQIQIGDNYCSVPTFNNFELTCNAPEGHGNFTPVVTVNGVNLNNTLGFSYFTPAINSLDPAIAYAGFSSKLIITGDYFGFSSSTINITLKSIDTQVAVACPLNDPTVASPSKNNPTNPVTITTSLQCYIPSTLSVGNYSVIVDISGSVSNDSARFSIINPPPPVSYNVTSSAIEAAVQPSVLIQLNAVSQVGGPPTYYINTLPSNGKLATEGGVVFTSVPASLYSASTVYYTPNQYFSGNDSFEYFATANNVNSNNATATIAIAFTNQAPVFVSTSLVVAMNESSETYAIDMLSLIYDPDEKQNFTFVFNNKPTRGVWSFNGKPTSFEPLVLQVGPGSRNILQLQLDGNGGLNPYFNFSGTATDSYGLTTFNTFEASGSVSCSIANSLNTWSAGPICSPCPVGAICSQTGSFPITNADGYYAVETSLNNQKTIIFIQCVPPEACPAQQYQSGTQTCAVGYNGTRCGTCAQGYYTYSSVCDKCPDLNISPLVLGLSGFFILIIVLYLAYKMSKMDLGFIGVVYTYFQALSAFYNLNLSWPPLVVKFLSFLSVFSLNIDLVKVSLIKVAPECFTVASPENSFEFKYYTTLAIPVCILGTATLVYGAYIIIIKFFPSVAQRLQIASIKGKRAPTVLSQILASILLSMKFLFLTLATTILSIFNCTYDSANAQYYFEPAPSRFCYIQSWWWKLLPYSISTLLIYICGTIAISTLVDINGGKARLERKKSAVDGKDPMSPMKWTDTLILDMTETEFPIYKSEYLYWDGVIMIRKLLLGIVISFATHVPQTQCVLLIMIFLISLIIQNKKRPYYKDQINDLEETSLISGSMVLLVGLIASARETTDPVFLSFLGVMIIVFICGSGVLMSWNILYHWYLAAIEAQKAMQKKLQRSFGSLNNVARKSLGSGVDIAKKAASAEDISKSVRVVAEVEDMSPIREIPPIQVSYDVPVNTDEIKHVDDEIKPEIKSIEKGKEEVDNSE